MNSVPDKLSYPAVAHPYQIEGARFLRDRQRAICADEMGLGKSLQAIIALRNSESCDDTVLITCPKAALWVWFSELDKWWPEGFKRLHIVIGDKFDRDRVILTIQDSINRGLWPRPIILATYDMVRIEADFFKALQFGTIIADEAHKFRNRTTKIHKVMCRLRTDNVYMLTGTPASKGPQDIWGLLHVINPKTFSSYWKFVNTFCHVIDNGFGKEIVGVRNEENLRALIRRYMIRRVKKEVAEELPDKIRQFLPVEMTAYQSKIYHDLEEDMMADLTEDLTVVTPLTITKLIRLRQLLICPQVLDPKGIDSTLEVGAGLTTIKEWLDNAESPHSVIFTPFSKPLPLIERFLHKSGYYNIGILKGGMKMEEVRDTIQEFEASKGIIICTIKFAQSFSLSTSSTAFFLGYEYNPDENYQAEDRLHRLTSKNMVNIYYLKYTDSVDEDILGILNTKQGRVNKMLRDPQALKELLRSRGNKNLDEFVDLEGGDDEDDVDYGQGDF